MSMQLGAEQVFILRRVQFSLIPNSQSFPDCPNNLVEEVWTEADDPLFIGFRLIVAGSGMARCSGQ